MRALSFDDARTHRHPDRAARIGTGHQARPRVVLLAEQHRAALEALAHRYEIYVIFQVQGSEGE